MTPLQCSTICVLLIAFSDRILHHLQDHLEHQDSGSGNFQPTVGTNLHIGAFCASKGSRRCHRHRTGRIRRHLSPEGIPSVESVASLILFLRGSKSRTHAIQTLKRSLNWPWAWTTIFPSNRITQVRSVRISHVVAHGFWHTRIWNEGGGKNDISPRHNVHGVLCGDDELMIVSIARFLQTDVRNQILT